MMKNQTLHSWRQYTWIATGIVLLFLALACGPGAEPTPTATAVPTVAPVATPTTAPAGPAATPTPTTVAAPTPTPGEQPKRGGRLFMIGTSTIPSYDIQTFESGTPDAAVVIGKVYNNLFFNPDHGKTECELCTEWHLENGGKTMVFNLIQGIKFHNGKELTSADIKYSLNKTMGLVDGIPSPRVGVIREYIDTIETPSRYVLKINLHRPSLYIPKVLSIIHGGVIYPEGTTRDSLQTQPNGSGPFLLTKVITGANWTLDRNPNYFKPGLPYLDGIDVVLVADASTRTANFLTHKTQYIVDQTPQYYPTLSKLRDEGKILWEQQDGFCGVIGVLLNNQKPPFSDVKLRKAVNLAIDRTEMMKFMWPLPGTGYPHLLYFSPRMEFGIPENQIWDVAPGWGRGAKKQQEIEEAKALVAATGHTKGLDIPQMIRGSATAGTTGTSATHEPVQQMLGKIGIRTTFELMPNAVVWQDRMIALDYNLISYLLCSPTKDPDDVIGPYWITGAPRNWTGYSNREVDRLFPLMSGELDPAKRKQLFLQMQDIIVVQDQGYAPLPNNNNWWWWWPTFGGFALGMDGTLHASSGFHRGDRLWLRN